MTKNYLFKIKEGKRQVWLDWCNEVMERYEEASETLEEERLIAERCLIFGDERESYVVYLHETVKEKDKLPANMEKDINITHFAKLDECLERIKPKVDGYYVESPVI